MSTVDIPDHYSVYFYVLDLTKRKSHRRCALPETLVPVTDDEWTDFTLPTPIDCPNGYMAGIAYGASSVWPLTAKETKEAWPFQPTSTASPSDYTSGEWTYLDQTDFKEELRLPDCRSTLRRRLRQSFMDKIISLPRI